MKHVRELQALRKNDPQAYEDEVQKLQLLTLSSGDDLTSPVSPHMAELVLLELDELNPVSSSRKDVEAALTDYVEDEYMGNSDMFVPYSEARKNGTR
ncbi:hypothetical protein KJ662_03975 [Patescibacteria group bacterium]|nr:hypothetical protein [Patescibacteria group bacterium]MBU1938454.1 hypothetical protein [Patescibacteria group bacterium]